MGIIFSPCAILSVFRAASAAFFRNFQIYLFSLDIPKGLADSFAIGDDVAVL